MLKNKEKNLIVCVHEDRPTHLVGLKLTVLSLLCQSPDVPIAISCPQAPDSLLKWAEAFSNLEIVSKPEFNGLSWNVKPTVLLHFLAQGYSEVIWIDADIIVNRDFRPCICDLKEETLVVTEEVYWGQKQGGSDRTIAWGLKPERIFPSSTNTGFIRVTPRHIKLIETWQAMLNHPAYREAQRQPYYKRPLHMVSDQEVLAGLLGSKEFSHIPVKMLRRGVDIAQCFGPAGYTPIERLLSLSKGLPPLIHAMGQKPWQKADKLTLASDSKKPLLKRLRNYYDCIHLELSPYMSVARRYKEQVGVETRWMNMETFIGKCFATLFANSPILMEFPLALFDSSVRRIRSVVGIGRYS